MSQRRVTILLLCEDNQQVTFARRFLQGVGWQNSDMRVILPVRGRGSGEQYVRENFIKWLSYYRQRRKRAATIFIVMLDADTSEVIERCHWLDKVCQDAKVACRAPDEAVAFIIPKRNIETWIHYLAELHKNINETEQYPKLAKASNCKLAVQNLIRLCQTTGLPPEAPPSLRQACREYLERIKSSALE